MANAFLAKRSTWYHVTVVKMMMLLIVLRIRLLAKQYAQNH